MTTSSNNPLQDIENRLLRIEEYLFSPGPGPTSPSILVRFQELDTKLASMEDRFASQADVDELKRAVGEIRKWIEARSGQSMAAGAGRLIRAYRRFCLGGSAVLGDPEDGGGGTGGGSGAADPGATQSPLTHCRTRLSSGSLSCASWGPAKGGAVSCFTIT